MHSFPSLLLIYSHVWLIFNNSITHPPHCAYHYAAAYLHHHPDQVPLPESTALPKHDKLSEPFVWREG